MKLKYSKQALLTKKLNIVLILWISTLLV